MIGTGRVVGSATNGGGGGFAVNGLGGGEGEGGGGGGMIKSEEVEGGEGGEVALSKEELRSVRLRNQASALNYSDWDLACAQGLCWRSES